MYVLVVVAARPNVSGDRLRLDAFVSLAELDRIRTAEILDQDAYIVGTYERRDGSIARYNLPFVRASNTRVRLVDLVLANQIPSRVNQQLAKGLIGPTTILRPTLILIVVFVYFIQSFRGGTGLFSNGRSGRRVEPEDAAVRFADVAGQDAAIAELREIADCLADPERYAALGGQVPRGVLLFGPPGCGKTLLAQALAGEAGAAFYRVSGSEFVEMYQGSVPPAYAHSSPRRGWTHRRSSSSTRSTPSARAGPELAPGPAGGGAEPGAQPASGGDRRLLLDREPHGGRGHQPSRCPRPGALRPGRFDRAVGLSLPDEAGRRSILAVHARSKVLGTDVDLDAVAHKAVGMSGADLAGVMNEAALLTARARQPAISQATLLAALERIREAPERRRRLSMRDRRMGQTLLDSDRVTFADIAGLDGAVKELAEIREYLADPARFERLGARIPAGYLLAGPAGTGKTLLARAVAGEANAGFVSVAATEFVEVFVGEGAARVRDLFAEVRGLAPAILFIDAIGGRRSGAVNDSSERAQTLNQLLIELDGFGRREGVVVLAATNRPELLDPALTRPGRLDRLIDIDLPDQASRAADPRCMRRASGWPPTSTCFRSLACREHVGSRPQRPAQRGGAPGRTARRRRGHHRRPRRGLRPRALGDRRQPRPLRGGPPAGRLPRGRPWPGGPGAAGRPAAAQDLDHPPGQPARRLVAARERGQPRQAEGDASSAWPRCWAGSSASRSSSASTRAARSTISSASE